MATDTISVAIACQGGGSHTAFAAGVLDALSGALPDGYVVDGLSGTSGGALTAAVAWDALRTADFAAVGDRVRSLWADVAADGPTERVANDLGVWVTTLDAAGLPVASVSPYANPAAWLGQSRLRTLAETHVDFDRQVQPTDPSLYVSSVDVLTGEFRTFPASDVTPRTLLASAAAPQIFPAVDVDGTPHWDGLFARNPPIKAFLSEPDAVEDKPDEIWIVAVNPDRRPEEPRTQRAIADRRSELSGNISLEEQVEFVERVTEWVDRGWLPSDTYKPVTVRWIRLSTPLTLSSRLDRDPERIEDLIERGRAAGTSFREGLS